MTYADFFDPETIRKFYVELRLHGDAQPSALKQRPRRPVHSDLLALQRVRRVLDRAYSMGERNNPLSDREIVSQIMRAVSSTDSLSAMEELLEQQSAAAEKGGASDE